MRLELRDKPEEKREPVARMYLEKHSMGEISLRVEEEDGRDYSVATFFNNTGVFYVYEKDLKRIGYTIDHTYSATEED